MPPSRLSLFYLAIAFYFCLVGSRLFYWQVWRSKELRQDVISQSYKLEKQVPPRGQILASDGFPLSTNQYFYQLSLYKPNFKSSFTDLVNQINQIQPEFISQNQPLLKNFDATPDQKWLTFPTHFTASQSEILKTIPGVNLQMETNRFSPETDLTRIITGFVGKNTLGQSQGYYGLEGYYHKQLEGKIGYIWQTKDALGMPLITQDSWQSRGYPGRDLHTFIHRGAQLLVSQELEAGVNQYQADSGMALVLRPQDGAIIAMSSFTASASASASATFNPTISHLFEPGSIFKPLVMAMALDRNAIDSDYICTECDHPLQIGQYQITNWNQETHPNSSLADILKNSDNIGMSHIITELGTKSFLNYFRSLNLNQKTGVDLQGEAKPPVKDSWPEIDLATASFGQGIALTPIQMTAAFNTLANHGLWVKPRVVDYLQLPDGSTLNNPPSSHPVYRSQTIEEIKRLLRFAVNQGTVARLKPQNLDVCAKSGTSQVAVKGGYSDSSTIASYIGFAPCDQPKFTLLVTLNHPRTTPWGASTAAPIWYNLAQKLNYLLKSNN
jgi:cell division protein FtsI/penicillin-binding protein 2